MAGWLLWDETLKLIADHPWTGVGPNGFVDSITGFHTLDWAVRVGSARSLRTRRTRGLSRPPQWADFRCCWRRRCWPSSFCAAHGRHPHRRTGADRDNLTGALAAVIAYGLMLLTAFTSPATTPLAAFICGGLVSTSRAAAPAIRPPAKATRPARGWNPSPPERWLLACSLSWDWASPCRLRSPNGRWPPPLRRRSRRPDDGGQPVPACLRSAALGLGHRAAGGAGLRRARRRRRRHAAANHAVEWARISLDRTPGSSEAALVLGIGYIYSGNLQQGKDTLDHTHSAFPLRLRRLSPTRRRQLRPRPHPGQPADLTAAAERAPDSAEPWTSWPGSTNVWAIRTRRVRPRPGGCARWSLATEWGCGNPPRKSPVQLILLLCLCSS